MVLKTEQPTRLRLGGFELNVKTGELCPLERGSNHRRILLQEQPFRVLQILIDCGGEIATRDEIKKWLWPNDTVVDFDHNINRLFVDQRAPASPRKHGDDSTPLWRPNRFARRDRERSYLDLLTGRPVIQKYTEISQGKVEADGQT